jgi:hypothetical protein
MQTVYLTSELVPPVAIFFPHRAETTRSSTATSGPLSPPPALFCGCCFSGPFVVRVAGDHASLSGPKLVLKEQILERTQLSKGTPRNPTPSATRTHPKSREGRLRRDRVEFVVGDVLTPITTVNSPPAVFFWPPLTLAYGPLAVLP